MAIPVIHPLMRERKVWGSRAAIGLTVDPLRLGKSGAIIRCYGESRGD
jgi:hypothetical protein